MPLIWSFQAYATAIKMGHDNSVITSPQGTWSVSLLKIGVLTGLFMFMLAGVNSEFEDQMGIPSTGLLCISDCSTCPVMCSPTPPSHSSPEAPYHNSPPPRTYHQYPPPPSPPPPPPPPQSPTPPPRQLPRASPPPTPSWYPSWGMPPPPPSGYYYGTPASKPPPTQGQEQGQHTYPFPYYYFYASSVPSLSVHASVFLSFLFFHLVYLCC